MKKKLLLTVLVGCVASACTQLPTERQHVVDLRPQISFKVSNEGLYRARVVVDDLDMGAIGDYLDGKASVRVVSGTHRVRVLLDGTLVLEERVYVGDGVNRAITVK